MILAALLLIAVLAVLLLVNVALIAHDLSLERRARRAAERRVPISV